MKHILLLLALLGLFGGTASAQKSEAKTKTKPAFLIGYATSFKDSVVYITTAQSLPLADVKSQMEAKAPYTLQWTNYMNARADALYPICVLFQAEKEKQAEKLIAQLKRKAYKAGATRIVEVQLSEFSFYPPATKIEEAQSIPVPTATPNQ